MAQLKKRKPNCAKCNKPILLYNNIIIIDLFGKYRNGICGDSINLLAIDKVMGYEGITTEDKPLVARKLILYATIIKNKNNAT